MGLIGNISKGLFRTGAQVRTDYHAVLSSALPAKRKRKLLTALTKMTVLQYVVSKVVPVTKVSFLSFKVETFNFYNLFFLFREIFVRGAYAVETRQPPHRILDCGANIGIATLFYKWMWPDVSIDCFEPDAETFELLKKTSN